ncbi:TPA: hypothetical protein UM795_000956 [Stenotrophomonas maltophilia]|nr:hypothetical protein [Stenotrophomonas maltophilia]
MSVSNKVDQFVKDSDIAHRIVHGPAGESVPTEGGPVPTYATAMKGLVDIPQRITALEDAQGADRVVTILWETLRSISGRENLAAEVVKDSGTHLDAASGQTVPNQGLYIWNVSTSTWQWVRPDGLGTKLDRETYDQMVKTLSVEQVLFAVTDQLGRATWLAANRDNGGPTDASVDLIRDAIPGLPIMEKISGLLVSLQDEGGRLTWLQAAEKDGGPTPYAADMIRYALGEVRGIVCEGDSMTQSTYGGGTSYPDKLSALLGRLVFNQGISGTNATEISVRAGGLVPLVSFPTGEIPSHTDSVSIAWDVENRISSGQPSRNYAGTIRGIQVTINYASATGVLTLKRKSAGEAVAVSSPVAFFMDTPFMAHNLHIVWAGRNDYPKSKAYAPIDAHLSRLERENVPFLILSVCNSSSEPAGSAGHTEIVELNAKLQKRAPRQFIDMRGRLIREGMGLAGLVPTQADLSAIQNDLIPPSLLSDGLHPNDAGRVAIAAIVLDEITYRGLLQ